MKTHLLHLHPEPFNKIKNGTKTIESRLYDAKRREFEIGDELVFINREDASEIKALITYLHHFPDFATLFKNLSSEKFSGESPESLLKEINQFYSESDQTLWGVVGIEFEIV